MASGAFQPSSFATYDAHTGIAFDQINDQQGIPASGPVTLLSGNIYITLAGVAAITLAAPGQDGQELNFFTETAQAHVVTCASVGFNGKGASGTATFAVAIGNGFQIRSRGGNWFVTSNIGVTIA